MKCQKCGREINDDLVFCVFCGTKLEKIKSTKPILEEENAAYIAEDKLKHSSDITISKKSFIIGSVICAAIILVLLLVLCVFIVTNTSNSGKSKNSIVGAWKNPNTNSVQFEFFEDGTCSGTGDSYYEATENGILRTFDVYHYPNLKLYYKVDKNKLYLAHSQEQLQEYISKGNYFIRD